MKVLIVIAAYLILSISAEDLDRGRWNKTQWVEQALNRRQSKIQNVTDSRLQHLNQALNRSRQHDRDRQQWFQALNKTNAPNSNRTQILLEKINRTQTGGLNAINRTQWQILALNRSRRATWNQTQWVAPKFNRTQWRIQNVTNSRLQYLNQALNRSRQQDRDRQQWLQALNKTNAPNSNRTQILLGKINRTQAGGLSALNRTQWQITALNRTRRATWVNPWNQTTHNGDVILGQIGYLDRLLFNQTYLKESRWWSGREKIIEYPKDLPGKTGWNRHENITAIRIYNKFYGGLESKAKIKSGGIGYRYVKIELSSPWNRGFHYLVQIFGH